MNKEDDNYFAITPQAIDELKALRRKHELTDNVFIKIVSRGNMDKGVKFNIKFVSEVGEFDSVYKVKDLQFLVDGRTLFYLNDFEIDFVNEGGKGNFIFRNLKNKKAL